MEFVAFEHDADGILTDDQVLVSSLLALSNVEEVAPATNLGGGDNVYLCGECSLEFATADDCSRHVGLAHDKPKAQEEVVEPRRSEAVFKCDVTGCSASFSTRENLNVHAACHGDGGQFRCRECGKACAKWAECAQHLWSAHGLDVGMHACPACDKFRAPTRARLAVHAQIHGEARRYACANCGKSFKQLAQLKNHSVVHLNKSKDYTPGWYSKKQCELCEKYFSDSKCLKKHVQAVHSKLRPYICHVCNHKSSRKAMLDMHMRQHTGEKPFTCDTCEYRTGDHNSLRRHKMRHTGEKPYKCVQCPYATIQSAAYKRHVKMKHPNSDNSATVD